MDPVVAFLIAAVSGLGAYAGWVTRAYISHLLSDLAYSRKSAHRGTELAERGTRIAEQKAS